MRSPKAKNSSSARRVTKPASAVTSPVEPHQTTATTAGIITAAVAMRIHVIRRLEKDGRLAKTAEIAAEKSSFGQGQGLHWPGAVRQTAVAPFALLVIDQRGVEFRAGEVRPKSFGDVNFGVGDLPEKEIAHPHFAAGADQKIRIGQTRRIQMVGDHLLVHAK